MRWRTTHDRRKLCLLSTHTNNVHGGRAGKKPRFLKKVFRFLGFFRFYKFFCTKTEHDSTTQKHMRKKNIPYMVRPSPSHGLQRTKLQASSITKGATTVLKLGGSERRRREPRRWTRRGDGACGRGVPHWGEVWEGGRDPPQKFFWIFYLKMVSFGAFWVALPRCM